MKHPALEILRVQSGWATFRLADESGWEEVEASYLSDCLGDLLVASRVLAEGWRDARVDAQDEPGLTRLVFEQSDRELRVQVIRLPKTFDRSPDASGTLLRELRLPLRKFLHSAATEFDRLIRTHSPEELRAAWKFGLPTHELAALKAAIGWTSKDSAR
ncbi:MAG TPA: hypothetical protein PKE29_04550 [Phycisphaerales bacterium]|nr:hypothetical protein [Phycisphaerales bacterium]